MTNIFESDELSISPQALSNAKISNLSDRPNREEAFGGNNMSAQDLKEAFDKIGLYVASK